MTSKAAGQRWIYDIAQDVRFALRLLIKERWFTFSAIGALALGIAVTTTMVTIINGYHFRGLPVDDPDRILYLGTRNESGRTSGMSYQDYQDWRTSRSFAGTAAFAGAVMTIGDKDLSPDSAGGAYVSASAFGILGETPVLGRGFLPADDRPGAPGVAILGHRLWTMRYEADPNVIGRSIAINGNPVTVIGVMADGFEFPFRQELWLPLALMPGIETQRRDERGLGVFGRLAGRVSAAQAQAELAGIAAALAKAYPETNQKIEPMVVPFGEGQVGRLQDQQPPLALIATAAFVLLIACVNVANLLLARSAGRAREIAIRASVGATRWRIVRQLIVEHLMLAFAAGGLGLWLSRFGVQFIADAFGRNVPYWMRFTVDGRVLAILVGLCVVTSLVFGLAPALFVSKTNAAAVMKEAARSGSPRARKWTNALLVAELAVALTLLASAALIMRSFLALYRTDTIVDASRILTIALTVPEKRYATPEQRAGLYQQLDERLSAIPGIPFATVASSRPFVAAPSRTLSFGDRPAGATGAVQPSVAVVWIGSRYFESLGVQVQRGRGFTTLDGAPGHDAAIVNQRFADAHFANANPLGQRIRLSQDKTDPRPSPWLTIVGVSPTIRQAVASGARPAVYLPLRTHAGAGAAILAGRVAHPATLAPILRKTVASLDPTVTLHNVRPLNELRADSRLQPRLVGTVLSAFAMIALLLSMVGLYAMTAYAVLQRTHEIGVRMALGAQPRQVVWLFVRCSLWPLGIGLFLGLVGAFLAGQLLRGILLQTGVTGWTTIGFIVLLFVSVALAACFFPARKAARLDPLNVLRYE